MGRDDEDEEDLDEDYREGPLAHETAPPEPESESPWPPGRFPDPATPPSPELPRLKAEFRTMVAEEYDRLTCRLEELEGGKADDEGHDADRADRAAFDDSPEGDRLHRYQAHWSRSLLRTLDAIHREGMEDEHDDGADGDEDVPVPGSSAADEPEVGRRRVPDAVLEVRPGGERRLGECSSRWRSEFGETNPRGGPKALEGRALWRALEARREW